VSQAVDQQRCTPPHPPEWLRNLDDALCQHSAGWPSINRVKETLTIDLRGQRTITTSADQPIAIVLLHGTINITNEPFS
jgi:hypothetical protein